MCTVDLVNALSLFLKINPDNKLLLSTHSEFFLTKITNLVLASKLTVENRKKLLGGNYYIDDENVGLYIYELTTEGVIIRELHLENGEFNEQPFFKFVKEVTNEATSIWNLIEDQKMEEND